MVRYGMVIDLRRCIGCRACVVACKQGNATPPGVFWTRVMSYEEGVYPNAKLRFLPILCMHCKEAACVKVCPTGATTKRDDGIVIVDSKKCVGCRYCIIACPYSVRFFVPKKPKGYYPGKGYTPYEEVRYREHEWGVVQKCNFCLSRVEKGEEPLCVQTCPASARYFGNLDDPNSVVSQLIVKRRGYQLRAELGTDPSVYYLPP